jgi:4-amino-4-deoxy-L-arabinose transferase-like glycosyltransferase
MKHPARGAEPGTASWKGYLPLLLLLAGLTRFIMIGRESLWLDEAASVRLAHALDGLGMKGVFITGWTDSHPPLYYAALRIWMFLFGRGEIALRSLSALCGVSAAALLFGLGVRVFTRETALIALFLFVLHPAAVYYAQEARMYALLTLLLLGCATLVFRFLDERRTLYLLPLAVVSLMILYCDYLGSIFLCIAYGYLFARLARERRKRELFTVVLCAVVVVLLFAPMTRGLIFRLRRGGTGWMTPPTLRDGGVVFLQMLGLLGGDGESLLPGTLAVSIGIPFVLLLIAAVANALVRGRGAVRVVALLSCAPALIFLTARFTPLHIFNLRQVVAYVPFLLLTLVHGTRSVVRFIAPQGRRAGKFRVVPFSRFALIVFFIMGALGATSLAATYGTDTKEDWRGIGRDLSLPREREPVALLIVPAYMKTPFSYYYEGGDTITAVGNPRHLRSFQFPASLRKYDQLFVVSAHVRFEDVYRFLRRDYDIAYSIPYRGVEFHALYRGERFPLLPMGPPAERVTATVDEEEAGVTTRIAVNGARTILLGGEGVHGAVFDGESHRLKGTVSLPARMKPPDTARLSRFFAACGKDDLVCLVLAGTGAASPPLREFLGEMGAKEYRGLSDGARYAVLGRRRDDGPGPTETATENGLFLTYDMER